MLVEVLPLTRARPHLFPTLEVSLHMCKIGKQEGLVWMLSKVPAALEFCEAGCHLASRSYSNAAQGHDSHIS